MVTVLHNIWERKQSPDYRRTESPWFTIADGIHTSFQSSRLPPHPKTSVFSVCNRNPLGIRFLLHIMYILLKNVHILTNYLDSARCEMNSCQINDSPDDYHASIVQCKLGRKLELIVVLPNIITSYRTCTRVV